MEGIQLSEPRITPTGGNALGGKKKPEGKDALLAVKPPPLETKVSSPHKADRGMCGPTSTGRCCCAYTPFLAILGVLLLVVGTGIFGQEGKLAWQRLRALLTTAMGGSSQLSQIQHAYSGAWVATIVLGTLLAAFVIVVYLLRIGQRLRQDGRMGAGISTERKYIALEWITAILAALLYAFCAWLAVYWGIMLLVTAGMVVAEQASVFGQKLFTAVLPLLRTWLTNASTSNSALTSLLSEVPAIGSNAPNFVATAFNVLLPTPTQIQAFVNKQTGNKLAYIVGSLLGSPAAVVNGVRSCPAATCVDLSKYAFMKSDACLCSPPSLLGSLGAEAADARVHFVRVLIGLALMYLGSSLLLSRLSAEAANIRADVNLLWTNKFDRLIMRRTRTGETNTTLGRASSMRAPTSAQTSPARGAAYPHYPV